MRKILKQLLLVSFYMYDYDYFTFKNKSFSQLKPSKIMHFTIINTYKWTLRSEI